MLAFERFSEGYEYLSEKLLLPMEYGAIPAYRGNGHQWIDWLSINREAFIDRNSFSSDEAFAKGIVELLRDPQRMDRMQHAKAFVNLQDAKDRIFFFNEPFKIGEKGYPALVEYVRNNPLFKRLMNKQVVTYYNPRSIASIEWLRFMLNAGEMRRVTDPAEFDKADIEFDWCCP